MKTKKTTTVKRATSTQTIMANLAKVEADLGSEAPAITAGEKRRKAKPRKGGERVVAMIGALAVQHGLDSSSLDSKGMLEEQQTADDLGPAEVLITKLLKRVSDKRFAAGSSAWQKALQLYALLQRIAINDGELATNLAPITSFFAYRHGDVLESKPTKLQTRAKAKLAHAERLAASARSRIGSETHVASPVVATPSYPVTSPIPQPAPVSAPVVQPATPVATQIYIAPKSNGALNGSYNGAANGAPNGGQ